MTTETVYARRDGAPVPAGQLVFEDDETEDVQ
jgi:hypothetical protein